MSTFLTLMILHLSTTALGALYVYRSGATLGKIIAIVAWGIFFFPVAYNVARFM